MNQNMLKSCQKFCPEFSGPGELYQFEPHGNENGKLIMFKPFPINTEIFKWISLTVSKNFCAQKSPKKSENGL